MRVLLIGLALLLSMPQIALSTADGPDHWKVHGVAKVALLVKINSLLE